MKSLLLAVAGCAMWGQMLELSVGGGVANLSNSGLGRVSAAATGDEFSLRGGFRLVFRMTTNAGDHFGHEFGYGYNRTGLRQQEGDAFTQTGMATHNGFYNYLVYATREGSRVRPFATGGGHFANYVPPGASASSGQGSSKFGVNYGGGVKFRVSERWMFRIDGRQYTNPKPFGLRGANGWIKTNELSASIAFVL
ncbi:MAG: porin family protein [Acidobacteria bacterium]|nr:porin family protein [Acidobacteriota bacterium]